ncbi:MAG TPA: hypothetical protein VNZ03_17915 [Terriglobales bacterium]|nr:hypothetical protein [Terriglobales bacterium]
MQLLDSLTLRPYVPGRIAFLRLADQTMNVIGHDDVAHDHKAIARADFVEAVTSDLDVSTFTKNVKMGQPA